MGCVESWRVWDWKLVGTRASPEVRGPRTGVRGLEDFRVGGVSRPGTYTRRPGESSWPEASAGEASRNTASRDRPRREESAWIRGPCRRRLGMPRPRARTVVPYHRGEILHGLGVSLGHLPGSQLGDEVSDRHRHFRLFAQTPLATPSRDDRGGARDREALWEL